MEFYKCYQSIFAQEPKEIDNNHLSIWKEIEDYVRDGYPCVVLYKNNPVCFQLYKGEHLDSTSIHIETYKCGIHQFAFEHLTRFDSEEPSFIRTRGKPPRAQESTYIISDRDMFKMR